MRAPRPPPAGRRWISGEAVARRRAGLARAQRRHTHGRGHGAHRRSAAGRAFGLRFLGHGSRCACCSTPCCRARPTAKLFHGEGALVFAATDAPVRSQDSARVERLPRAAGGLDLHAVMHALDANSRSTNCWSNAGRAWPARSCSSHLVDEFVLYVAPTLLGADAAPLLHVSGLGPPGSLPAFEFKDVRRIGADLRLILTTERSPDYVYRNHRSDGPRDLPDGEGRRLGIGDRRRGARSCSASRSATASACKAPA